MVTYKLFKRKLTPIEQKRAKHKNLAKIMMMLFWADELVDKFQLKIWG